MRCSIRLTDQADGSSSPNSTQSEAWCKSGSLAVEPRMDRITSIRARNVRTLVDVKLDSSGLTVLVGPNGSGKSTLLEICQILSHVPSSEFLATFYGVHGGLGALARAGSERVVELGITTTDDLDYWLRIGEDGTTPRIEGELFTAGDRVLLSRKGTVLSAQDAPQVEGTRLALPGRFPNGDMALRDRLMSTIREGSSPSTSPSCTSIPSSWCVSSIFWKIMRGRGLSSSPRTPTASWTRYATLRHRS